MALSSERAFRQEVFLCFFLVPFAVLGGFSVFEKLFLISSLFLVLMVELLNSGIEAVVDKASPEIHPLAKRAKDVASAAVLVAIINAIIVWGLILV